VLGADPLTDHQRPAPVVQPDRLAGPDDRGDEADRGDVPLADLPQADHRAQFAGRQAGLIRVRHHRRVAQRRRLDRVLVAEVRADQRPAGRRQRDVRRHPVADQVVVVLEDTADVVVPAGEPGQHVVQHLRGLVLVELQDPLDQAGGAVVHELGVLARHEEFDHHALIVRRHGQVQPGGELRGINGDGHRASP
jgi:hypothetical protein